MDRWRSHSQCKLLFLEKLRFKEVSLASTIYIYIHIYIYMLERKWENQNKHYPVPQTSTTNQYHKTVMFVWYGGCVILMFSKNVKTNPKRIRQTCGTVRGDFLEIVLPLLNCSYKVGLDKSVWAWCFFPSRNSQTFSIHCYDCYDTQFHERGNHAVLYHLQLITNTRECRCHSWNAAFSIATLRANRCSDRKSCES